jgi:hypothetical protein
MCCVGGRGYLLGREEHKMMKIAWPGEEQRELSPI